MAALPAEGGARSPEVTVDAAVDRLRAALSRHDLQFPSLRSDTVPSAGTYLVVLGGVPASVVTALAGVLDRAGVL